MSDKTGPCDRGVTSRACCGIAAGGATCPRFAAVAVFAAVDCNLVNEGSYLQFCVHAEVVVGFHMQTPLIVAFLVSSSQESGVAECSKADNVFAEVPKAVIAFCLEHGGAVRSSRIWQALTEKLPDRCLMIDC